MKIALPVGIAALLVALLAPPAVAGGWHFGFGSGGSHAPSYGYRHGSGWGQYRHPNSYGYSSRWNRGHSYGRSYGHYARPNGYYGRPNGYYGGSYGTSRHRHDRHCTH